MPRYDVFLSHAGADKPAVERLARRLRGAGVALFFGEWDLVPGERWIEELSEALAQSDTLAVFVGPRSGGGAWRTREVELALAREARESAFRIIPVLLPGGDEPAVEEISSGFLGLLTWVDFRAGLDDDQAFGRLLAGIRGEAPDPALGGGRRKAGSYRCMAPAREPFVQRSEYAKVRDALLMGGTGDPGRATTVGIATAIHGGGGFGKTSLAVEICYDEQIRERYPDGILWVQMSDTLTDDGRLKEIRDVLRLWSGEEPPAFETVAKAGQHLIESLKGRRVLLVVDDVWRPEDVTPFQGLGPRAALLLTTRDSRTLPAGSASVHVDAMDLPEAVRMLGAGLPEGTSVDLMRLATRLGEWPLLLKIVNRQLRELIQDDGLLPEQSLREVNEALDAEGLTAFDREDLESRSEAVARTVGASLLRLSGEEVDRFEQLAIFPEDKDIPLRVLERLWDLASFATKKFCGRLHHLSLLLRFDRLAGTIRLHDVIRAYLLKRGESRLPEWHRRFLDTFRPANGRWSDLPKEEDYLWDHLFHHLIGAEGSDVCWNLLWDLRYLQAKLEATDINALLGDYSHSAENEHETRLVRDALRLSSHVLQRSSLELLGQLRGRLLDQQDAGIQDLLEQPVSIAKPWLRPRKASLTRPGGALIRSIELPELAESLVVLPDGRVVSCSLDGALRLWDVESGEVLRILEEPLASGYAMALDDHRVVYNSDRGTFWLWDVTSGQIINIFSGHSSLVARVVAVFDCRRVLSYFGDGTLRMLDVESGQILQIFGGHWASGTAVVLESYRVVFSSVDGTLHACDAETGQVLQTSERYPGGVSALASLDSTRVLVGSFDGTVHVWDVENGHTVRISKMHSAGVSAFEIFDDQRVAVGFEDGLIRVWNLQSGQALQTLEGHFSWVNALAVLGGHLLISCSDDRTLRVWNVGSDQVKQSREVPINEISALVKLDCSSVISGSEDGTTRVWDVESGQALYAFKTHAGRVGALVLLDRQLVVSGSDDRTVKLWNIPSGKVIQTLGGHSGSIISLTVLDNCRVISGSADLTLRVWDAKNGKALQQLEGHSGWINFVAVVNHGRVVSGSEDGTLRIWDIEKGRALKTLEGDSGFTSVAAIDSDLVVSGSEDGLLHLWNLESGQILRTPGRALPLGQRSRCPGRSASGLRLRRLDAASLEHGERRDRVHLYTGGTSHRRYGDFGKPRYCGWRRLGARSLL